MVSIARTAAKSRLGGVSAPFPSAGLVTAPPAALPAVAAAATGEPRPICDPAPQRPSPAVLAGEPAEPDSQLRYAAALRCNVAQSPPPGRGCRGAPSELLSLPKTFF